METAKFTFKFNNEMLPDFFNKLDNVDNYNTRKKNRSEFFQCSVASESRRKTLHHCKFHLPFSYSRLFIFYFRERHRVLFCYHFLSVRSTCNHLLLQPDERGEFVFGVYLTYLF